MTSGKTSPLIWIAVIATIILLGAMTFLAGFGAGFGTGRVTAPQLASLDNVGSGPVPFGAEPGAAPGSTATVAPQPRAASGAQEIPEDFDLIWEAWEALEESFYGDLPATPEMVGGLVTGMLRAAEIETDQPLDMEETADAIINATLSVLEERYGELPNVRRLAYGAINGFARELNDDYTYLRDPQEAEFFNESLEGAFEGIGARVSEADGGGVRIVEPFEGQPAWNAGLRRDDVILAVDGQDITRMTLQEAISLIRGPRGTEVMLLVRTDAQEPREVEITRELISVPAVEFEMREDGIAYLRLGEFSAPAAEQVSDALEELLAQDPIGLVLDVRGNPGGFLRTAIDITSEFVPEGPVAIERFKDGSEEVFEASGRGQALSIPLVVLVNEGSASASEILAGAVQDSGRGILLGTTTFGKGSVQVPSELSDGSVMSITTARWFTPNDRQINGLGLRPDIEVERTAEDFEADRDPQLDRAVQYLLELLSAP